MNELTLLLDKAKAIVGFIESLTKRHRFSTIFVISSIAVIMALLQSGAYLNPSRNNRRYEEALTKINYKAIDQKTVKKLQKSQQDKEINVSPDFVQNRNNPFAE